MWGSRYGNTEDCTGLRGDEKILHGAGDYKSKIKEYRRDHYSRCCCYHRRKKSVMNMQVKPVLIFLSTLFVPVLALSRGALSTAHRQVRGKQTFILLYPDLIA